MFMTAYLKNYLTWAYPSNKSSQSVYTGRMIEVII